MVENSRDTNTEERGCDGHLGMCESFGTAGAQQMCWEQRMLETVGGGAGEYSSSPGLQPEPSSGGWGQRPPRSGPLAFCSLQCHS